MTVPDYAFQAVPYVVYLAPAGSLPGGDFVSSPDGTDTIVYSDATGFAPATVLLNFNTKPRSLLAAPEAVSGVDGEFVYTSGDLSATLPSSLAVGSIIGLKPANGGSSFIVLTVVDCTPPPVTARIDVLPGLRVNYVIPRLRAPVLPVLIYGSATVNVQSMTSVHLQDAAAASVPAILSRPFDANHDGYLDRVYWFSPIATGIACGQTSVTLTGQTTGGTHIVGTDSIRTVC